MLSITEFTDNLQIKVKDHIAPTRCKRGGQIGKKRMIREIETSLTQEE